MQRSFEIQRQPQPEPLEPHTLRQLPRFDHNSRSNFQVDLRAADLRGLDLRDRLDDLRMADFDTATRWPRLLPREFSHERVFALGMNPGLGLRRLHRLGHSGGGVGIGLVDVWGLLLEHEEYQHRLQFYAELGVRQQPARTHFCAMASLALGRCVGVAPEAHLFAVGVGPDYRAGDPRPYATHLARAIERLLEVSRGLPPARRIRVIVCPMRWPSRPDRYTSMVHRAVKRACKEGVFVLSCGVEDTYPALCFNRTVGLGRQPDALPDLVESYEPSGYPLRDLTAPPDGGLLVPMDSRCMAGAAGPDHYLFVRHGGSSWVVAYLAGLYALCCEARPDTTPESFWSRSMRTGTLLDVPHRHPGVPGNSPGPGPVVVHPDGLLRGPDF